MSTTFAYRLGGKTTKVSVTATASNYQLISDNTNTQVTYAAFLNGGTKPCAVSVNANGEGDKAAFPGASAGDFVLPASMIAPIVLAVPQNEFYLSAVCDGTDTTTLYVTPVINL